ncbi:hypothetical protein H9P43_001851 [Blastocladiella emersonii ATCC 22665]|nr:hypothetical protein H9P43_001851 [Blastocladiella emersonii ATCC 22665]
MQVAATTTAFLAHNGHDHPLALCRCSAADEPTNVDTTTLASVSTLSKQFDDPADAQALGRRVSFSLKDLVYEFELEYECKCDESESDEFDGSDESADLVPELKSEYRPAPSMSTTDVYARRCEMFGPMWNELATTNPTARAEAVRLMRDVFAGIEARKQQHHDGAQNQDQREQELEQYQPMAVVDAKHMKWQQWQQPEARAWQSAPHHVSGSTSTQYQQHEYQRYQCQYQYQQRPQTFHYPVQTLMSTGQPRVHQAFEWHDTPAFAPVSPSTPTVPKQLQWQQQLQGHLSTTIPAPPVVPIQLSWQQLQQDHHHPKPAATPVVVPQLQWQQHQNGKPLPPPLNKTESEVSFPPIVLSSVPLASLKQSKYCEIMTQAKRWVRYHCSRGSGSSSAVVGPTSLTASKGSELGSDQTLVGTECPDPKAKFSSSPRSPKWSALKRRCAAVFSPAAAVKAC